MEVERWSCNLCPRLSCQVLYGNTDERSLCLLSQELAVQWRRPTCKQIIAVIYSNVEVTEVGRRKEWHSPLI